MEEKQVVIFGLVRGYAAPGAKWRYLMMVSRNLAIRIHELKTRTRFTKVIFHEGNISTLDRWVVNFASLGGFQFVDVSETFSDQGGASPHRFYSPIGLLTDVQIPVLRHLEIPGRLQSCSANR